MYSYQLKWKFMTDQNVSAEFAHHISDGAYVLLQELSVPLLLLPCSMGDVQIVNDVLLDLVRSVKQSLCGSLLCHQAVLDVIEA